METSTEMTSSQTPTDVNRKLRLSSFTTQIIIYISHMYNSEGGILKTVFSVLNLMIKKIFFKNQT